VPETLDKVPSPAVPARYRIVEAIGEGAASLVYRAVRRIDGREVAIKVHREPRQGAQLVAFRREFRILAEHPHRNLLRVFDCGVHEGLPYVVMDLAAGGDAEALVGSFPANRLRSAARDLLEGLDHLHRQGLVHRDLKPGNLLVEEREQGPRLRIADLGLSAPVDDRATCVAGTPGYLAPEYLDGATPSPRSDLFALGACLYELACGRPAFPSPDPVESMVEARQGVAETLAEVAPAVPVDVRELIERLLDPLPARRPEHAGAALELLDGAADPEIGRLAPAPLVGRADPIDAVRWALTLSARRSRLHAALLECEPRMGGTRLLTEAATLGRRLDCVVLSFAPESGEDGRAALSQALFNAELDRLDACAGAPVADRGTWPTLRGIVGALDSTAPVAGAAAESEGVELLALIHAFGVVVSELARQRRTLFLVDAPPSAGPLAAQLLAAICRTAADEKLALVVTSRHGDPPRLPGIGDHLRRATLAPLDAGETRGVLEGVLHSDRLTTEFVDAVYGASGGAPGAVVEALRALMRTGQLRREERWTAELPGARFKVPELCRDAPEPLPADLGAAERAVVEALATLEEATVATVAAVARRAPEEIEGLLDRLEDQGFVTRRIDPMAPWEDPTLRFSAASTAQALLLQLDPIQRAVLHGRAADGLRASLERCQRSARPRKLARIGSHLAWSDDYHAAKIALDEASECFAALHLYVEQAESLQSFVATHCDRVPEAMVEQLRLSWGQALERAGRGHEVGEALDPVLRSREGERRARAAACLAKAALGIEQPDAAREALEVGISAAASLPLSTGGSLRVILLHRLGLVHLAKGDIEGCVGALDQAEALVDRVPDGREQRARLGSTRARVDIARGQLDQAADTYAAALAVFEELDDHRRATACEVALGAIHYQSSEYAAAARSFHDAAERSRRANDLRGYLVALSNRAVAQSDGGQWAEAAEAYRDVLAVAGGVGDLRTRMRTLNNLGMLLRDRGEARRARGMLEEGIELARSLADPAAEAILEGNLGELDLLEGQAEAARARFDKAVRGLAAAAPGSESEALLESPEGIEATRRIATWEAEHGDPVLARALVAGAIRSARKIGARAELAHLLAASAAVAERQGADAKALHRYARARREMSDLRLDHAAHRVDVARARLLLEAGRHGAARALLEHALGGLERLGALADHGEANRLLMELEDDEPLRVQTSRFAPGDHLLEHLLDITLQINAIHELAPLLDLIAHKTVELTGARRALVFLRSTPKSPTELAASAYRDGAARNGVHYSRSFVEDIFRSGESRVVTNVADAEEISRRSSIRKLQLRFIIGVPVADMQGVIGALYVDDDRAVYDVSREELFVLQSLANQAALAIRNAQLFERATIDSLTRVSMRHHLLQRLEEEFLRALERGTSLALLMLDIDHFKTVNDDFGHGAGDRVLAETAALIRQVVGERGAVGRLGGEEFAVVLPRTRADRAFDIADEVRTRIEQAPLVSGRALTCSIGVVALSAVRDGDLALLLPSADGALYEAKRGGRNCVVITERLSALAEGESHFSEQLFSA